LRLAGVRWIHGGTQQLQLDHFYTADAAERQSALANDSYLDEGIACHIFKEEVYGTAEFSRIYNPGATDHFYTTDAEEQASALAAGYQDEGSVGYVFPDQSAVLEAFPSVDDKTAALYRLYLP
jgi:hypothetical protein